MEYKLMAKSLIENKNKTEIMVLTSMVFAAALVLAIVESILPPVPIPIPGKIRIIQYCCHVCFVLPGEKASVHNRNSESILRFYHPGCNSQHVKFGGRTAFYNCHDNADDNF